MYSCDQQCYDYTNGHILMQAHSQSPFNLVAIKYGLFFRAEGNDESYVESDSPFEIAESAKDTCIGISN